MNKIIFLLILMIFSAGCATNIAQLPITPRDQESYANPSIKKNDKGKEEVQSLKVAIVQEEKNIKDEILKKLTDNFRDNLDSAISNLADFESIPRSEISAIMSDNEIAKLTSDDVKDVKIKAADFMLIFKITNYAMVKNDNLVGGLLSQASSGGQGKGSYKGEIKAKITLINVNENKKEFTKSITGLSTNSAESAQPQEATSPLGEACENAVKDFVTQFSVDYAPPAIVEQTKGSGKVALISLGKNYGLMKGMKIEFYELREKDGKKHCIPFAYGKILEVEEDAAWVDVEDFEKAGVKENHFARVRRDQSKSFLEKLTPE